MKPLSDRQCLSPLAGRFSLSVEEMPGAGEVQGDTLVLRGPHHLVVADRPAGLNDGTHPFADGLKVLAGAGVRAIVEPGGSVRDDEVVEAAHNEGVTLYFTGARHFFH